MTFMTYDPRPLIFILLLLLPACSTPQAAPVTETATAFQPIATPLPTWTPLPPSATPSNTPIPPQPIPDYEINATLDYRANRVDVSQRITYTNTSPDRLSKLVLAVTPNLWTNCFTLNELRVNKAIVQYTLDGHRLEVILLRPLGPGDKATLEMTYLLALPETNPTSNYMRDFIFGATGRQTNLVDWYPFIVPYNPSEGWILHDDWSYGENLVYDPANFEVTLRFVGDKTDLTVAASGAETSASANERRFLLERGRTFALSVSDQMGFSRQATGGLTVYSFYLPEHAKQGEAVLTHGIRSILLYSRLFGEYPHPTYTIVESDFPHSMEYDGLVFVNRALYGASNGTGRDFLPAITAHETAHQWWFGLVANDQALEPWLDESLSTYSEYLYQEVVFPESTDWWMTSRIQNYDLSGWVDTRLYDHGRSYTTAVYRRGAVFLHDLRTLIGDEAFFAFLKDYASRFRHGRATGDDFFAVLSEHTDEDIRPLMEKYFQNR